MTAGRVAGPARPDDFAPPPTGRDRARWSAADRSARPVRIARLRERLEHEGLDAYFGTRPEHTRYLTGFVLGDGEDRVAGSSGWFLVGAREVVVPADSRYRVQAEREATDARIEPVYGDLGERWLELLASLSAGRVAVEADSVSHATWTMLADAAPGLELVPVQRWLESDRATKEPAEVDRIAAACAVADRALAALLPEIRVGVTERDLALRLEWLMRTGGADGLAFDVACLSGPEAALPHGSPDDRPVRAGTVLLFDFGAQVDGYRSDMTRTLFIGEPSEPDRAIYELVAAAQAAAIEGVSGAVRAGRSLPSGRAVDSLAREVIDAAGHGERFGHGTGHGIGLATHELPRLGRTATDDPLPSPTVFSVEPGIYLDGEMGVRIEDLLAVDLAAGRCERLTAFPREIVVIDS